MYSRLALLAQQCELLSQPVFPAAEPQLHFLLHPFASASLVGKALLPSAPLQLSSSTPAMAAQGPQAALCALGDHHQTLTQLLLTLLSFL